MPVFGRVSRVVEGVTAAMVAQLLHSTPSRMLRVSVLRLKPPGKSMLGVPAADVGEVPVGVPQLSSFEDGYYVWGNLGWSQVEKGDLVMGLVGSIDVGNSHLVVQTQVNCCLQDSL